MNVTPRAVPTEVFAAMPERFLKKRRNAWTDANRGGEAVGCFLEGPSFDRDGNLWVTDIPFGRVFRISPDGADWTQVAEYDGWPNGLKIHKDGRIFLADYKRGVVLLDPASGRTTPLVETHRSESFKGVNDLFFAANGDLWFTDQGQTGLHDATGRIFRLRASDGRLDKLIDTIPSPNGIVLNLQENIVLIGVTRANAVWRAPIMPDGAVSKVGLFIQMSGSAAGPDGMALDVEGGLAVAQPGMTVLRYDRFGRLTHYLEPDCGLFCTNVAYGGADMRSLFVVDSGGDRILRGEMPAAGKPMFSHA